MSGEVGEMSKDAGIVIRKSMHCDVVLMLFWWLFGIPFLCDLVIFNFSCYLISIAGLILLFVLFYFVSFF